MRRLLCWLGYHRWKAQHRLRQFNRSVTHLRGVDKCTRCGKTFEWNSTTIKMELAVLEILAPSSANSAASAVKESDGGGVV